MCQSGIMHGFHTTISETMNSNLLLVKEALTALASSDVDYLIVVAELPQALGQICEDRRKQAKVFLESLMEQPIYDKTVSE